MKQQVLFFFFTLMLTGISVSAQTGGGRIAGVVIDNAGEEPLPGATIFIEELKKGIVTDGHGEFLLSDVPAATYTLTVRFIGYHTQTRKLTVGKERGKKIIIRLKAEAKSLDEVVVMGKSEARKLREQAMPISVISMKPPESPCVPRVERAVPLAYRCADWKANASGFSLTGIR